MVDRSKFTSGKVRRAVALDYSDACAVEKCLVLGETRQDYREVWITGKFGLGIAGNAVMMGSLRSFTFFPSSVLKVVGPDVAPR
jgi:hypothetical protein